MAADIGTGIRTGSGSGSGTGSGRGEFVPSVRDQRSRRSQAQLATTQLALRLGAVLVVAACLGLSSTASADPCNAPDDGTGTVTLPPIGCDYLSPDEVHVIIDGLPPGTTIELAPIHKDFICNEQPGAPGDCGLIPPGLCEAPGGGLGGNVDCFQSTVELQATGTGALAGFNRTLFLQQGLTEIHTGPRTPGDPVQTFPTEIVAMDLQLFGDPDFDILRIRAGSAFGLPSPGETTLTERASGDFAVDSFFDIVYEIEFQGAPGSTLEGLAGTTVSSLSMVTGDNPCTVSDNGTGTVTLPPDGCEYLSPTEVHEIIDGLPPGTTIVLDAIHKNFICSPRAQTLCSSPPGLTCETAGGGLGGNLDCADSTAELTISGTGALSSFSRTISVPLFMEVHTGPRTPGAPVQDFPTEMVALEGQIFGDPDFDLLRITGGTSNGLSGSGRTTLTERLAGDYTVDSFFDIVYEIDFQGAPGGQLDGFSGSTTGSLRMETGNPAGNPSVPSLGSYSILAFAAALAAIGVAVLKRRSAQTA
jgi:hypothetical protein